MMLLYKEEGWSEWPWNLWL